MTAEEAGMLANLVQLKVNSMACEASLSDLARRSRDRWIKIMKKLARMEVA